MKKLVNDAYLLDEKIIINHSSNAFLLQSFKSNLVFRNELFLILSF